MSTPSAPTAAPADQTVKEILDGVAYIADLDRKRNDAANRAEALVRDIEVKIVSDSDLARLAQAVWAPRVMVEIRDRMGHPITGVSRNAGAVRVDGVSPNLSTKDVLDDPTACAHAVLAFKARFGAPERQTSVRVIGVETHIWVGPNDTVESVRDSLIALYA